MVSKQQENFHSAFVYLANSRVTSGYLPSPYKVKGTMCEHQHPETTELNKVFELFAPSSSSSSTSSAAVVVVEVATTGRGRRTLLSNTNRYLCLAQLTYKALLQRYNSCPL